MPTSTFYFYLLYSNNTVLEIMNGFILCVVRTYGISRIFGDGIFILESDFSDFRDFYNLL